MEVAQTRTLLLSSVVVKGGSDVVFVDVVFVLLVLVGVGMEV